MRDAHEVACLLEEIGTRLELTGEVPFKTRAYSVAAETLRGLKEPLETLVAQRKLKTLPGVGEAIAEKITSLHKTGTHPTLERLREEIPAGLLDMLRVRGLGPKKVLALREALGIDSLEKLAQAAESGKLAGVKGFGASAQAKILDSVDFIRATAGYLRLPDAEIALVRSIAYERKQPGALEHYEVAGDVRRRCETASKLALVAQDKARAGTSAPSERDKEITLYFSSPQNHGAVLLWATGSSSHLEQLQVLAKKKGLTLSERGLLQGSKVLETLDEASVYKALGLPFIPPELREGRHEIEWAQNHKLPELAELSAYRGSLHNHSTWSDGAHTLEQMAESARSNAWSYFAITDHSQTAIYANGLKPDRVKAQHKEVDALRSKFSKEKFKIFKGVESDILQDGALDYEPEVLASFDVIVASVHDRFELDKKKQTARILKAVSNPHTLVLGHPTGRLLLDRPEYPLDHEAVIDACAKHGVAVEINANPARLDLDWRWMEYVKKTGALVSINPDAHATDELELTRYGFDMARKGAVPVEKIINTWSLDKLEGHLDRRRSGRSAK